MSKLQVIPTFSMGMGIRKEKEVTKIPQRKNNLLPTWQLNFQLFRFSIALCLHLGLHKNNVTQFVLE